MGQIFGFFNMIWALKKTTWPQVEKSQTRWVTLDCDTISNFIDHKFVAYLPHAAAAGIKAGTDIDCGSTYGKHLGAALLMGLVNVSDISGALTRQYASLVRLGYFDPAASQPYRQLGWTDVNTQDVQNLAYQSAVEGSVLLKNDGTLPLAKSIQKLVFIGPWANATTQMQGNYTGITPFLISPLAAARTAGFSATLTQGMDINSTDTSGFADALAAAQAADAIVYAGGIDDIIEGETKDRKTITWPGNQLDLITQLAELGKPLVMMQFGGGQVDDAALKNNSKVGFVAHEMGNGHMSRRRNWMVHMKFATTTNVFFMLFSAVFGFKTQNRVLCPL
ncbi:glycosyl hydrolase family 3 C-terminal domain-containing protein [Mycena sp. CBHHK59/15]|nr:glycosyl hydrolase family 3 C-terminal domain-containing protein [Mycena sp. CBHHK59/15]